MLERNRYLRQLVLLDLAFLRALVDNGVLLCDERLVIREDVLAIGQLDMIGLQRFGELLAIPLALLELSALADGILQREDAHLELVNALFGGRFLGEPAGAVICSARRFRRFGRSRVGRNRVDRLNGQNSRHIDVERRDICNRRLGKRIPLSFFRCRRLNAETARLVGAKGNLNVATCHNASPRFIGAFSHRSIGHENAPASRSSSFRYNHQTRG